MWPVRVGVEEEWVWPVSVGEEEEVGGACECWGRGRGGWGL